MTTPYDADINALAHIKGSFLSVPLDLDIEIAAGSGGSYLYSRLLDYREGYLRAKREAAEATAGLAAALQMQDHLNVADEAYRADDISTLGIFARDDRMSHLSPVKYLAWLWQQASECREEALADYKRWCDGTH